MVPGALSGLIERVSGKHVASLLGKTSVTLSRIKRAIREGRVQTTEQERVQGGAGGDPDAHETEGGTQ